MVRAKEGWAWWKSKTSEAAFAAALLLPSPLRRYLLPRAGEGPDRDVMERGWMTLRARAVVEAEHEGVKDTKIVTGKFHFNKDVGYLYTAAMLAETGLLMLETRDDDRKGGVLTPAAAFGSRLTKRILDNLDARLEIREIDKVPPQ